MKTRMVITKSFKNEMLECFGCESAYDEEQGWQGAIYLFRLDAETQNEAAFYGNLANVMKKAILSSNSILRNSERLTNIIDRIVFRGSTEKIENGVMDFFRESDDINLDGYVYFVLNEYSEKINSILYHAVKNSLRAETIN